MPNAERPANFLRELLLATAVLLPVARLALNAQVAQEMRLFRLVTIRTDMLIGVSCTELSTLGAGSEAERLARRIAEEGALSAWHYVESRGHDGDARLTARQKITVRIEEALLIEPFTPTIPVVPPAV